MSTLTEGSTASCTYLKLALGELERVARGQDEVVPASSVRFLFVVSRCAASVVFFPYEEHSMAHLAVATVAVRARALVRLAREGNFATEAAARER